ncbi:MAG: DUF4157 domain-containing protein [Spirulina sp. SIO3F2]|nr:DUF4157 domain-containing protein [Spirulina sp. SIO3F2]
MARRSYASAAERPKTKKQPPTQTSKYSRPFPAPQPIQAKKTDDGVRQPSAGTNYNALTLPVHRPSGTPAEPEFSVMPKLTIGAVNDPYEQEADRVAAQVVQQLNAPPDAMQRQGYGEAESSSFEVQPLVQRKGSSPGGIAAPAELEDSIQRERSKGQHLADSIRQPLENAMGADFSGVRIHTDSTANQLSESIQAKAFTTGQDVFFRQGAYDPGSKEGQGLLAHELTHVVQQNGSAIQLSESIQRYPEPGDDKILQRERYTMEVHGSALKSVAPTIERSFRTIETQTDAEEIGFASEEIIKASKRGSNAANFLKDDLSRYAVREKKLEEEKLEKDRLLKS